MAQIHALTPEGRLPSAAVAHVQEIAVPPTWEDLPGKPATYPPATHTHVVSEVTGLEDRLAGIEGDIEGALSVYISEVA